MKKLIFGLSFFTMIGVSHGATQIYIPSTSTFHNYTINIVSGTINTLNVATGTLTNATISTANLSTIAGTIVDNSTTTHNGSHTFSNAVTISNTVALNATSITGSLINGNSNGVAIQGSNTNDSAGSGKYFETVSTSSSNLANGSNATFVNYISTGISAGDWWCNAGVEIDINGATATGYQVALSTFSGNTVTDHTAGVNVDIEAHSIGTGDVWTSFIPPYEIKAAGTMTVYLKYRLNFSVGTPRIDTGTLTCHRAR